MAEAIEKAEATLHEPEALVTALDDTIALLQPRRERLLYLQRAAVLAAIVAEWRELGLGSPPGRSPCPRTNSWLLVATNSRWLTSCGMIPV